MTPANERLKDLAALKQQWRDFDIASDSAWDDGQHEVRIFERKGDAPHPHASKYFSGRYLTLPNVSKTAQDRTVSEDEYAADVSALQARLAHNTALTDISEIGVATRESTGQERALAGLDGIGIERTLETE